jgi:hypothetical protein
MLWTLFVFGQMLAQSAEYFVPNSFLELRPDYIASQCELTDDHRAIAASAMQTLAARHHLQLKNLNPNENQPYPVLDDEITPPQVVAFQLAEDLYQLEKQLYDVCADIINTCLRPQNGKVTDRTNFESLCDLMAQNTYQTQKTTAQVVYEVQTKVLKNYALGEFHRAQVNQERQRLVVSPLRALVFSPFKQSAERITGLIRNPKTK